jgi:hypothetical protein
VRTPEQAYEHSLACIWPRWDGDPYPEAQARYREAEQRQANAWQAVADEAQREANAALSVRIRFTDGRGLADLINAARRTAEPVREAAQRAFRAEETRPPWERRRCGNTSVEGDTITVCQRTAPCGVHGG